MPEWKFYTYVVHLSSTPYFHGLCRMWLSGCRFVLPLQMNVNPEDLIPKLPQPKDLQPFPTTEAIVSLLYFSSKMDHVLNHFHQLQSKRKPARNRPYLVKAAF